MFDTPAKRVREHVARAKRSLNKGEVARSLEHIQDALHEMLSSQIFGRDKFEVEVHLQEFLKEFNGHSDIKEYFNEKGVHVTPYVSFSRGKEKDVLDFFKKVHDDMVQDAAQAQEDAQANRDNQRREMLDRGQQLLDAGELPKAKAMFRRLVEEFHDVEGLKTNVGERLLKAELYFEAGELLEEAVAENPRDSHALAHAVQAYKSAREYPKMEKLYKIALKTFGSHPKTLLHMAEMYLDWKKFDEAYDFAKQAYDADNSLDKAKEIVDVVGKRIFT